MDMYGYSSSLFFAMKLYMIYQNSFLNQSIIFIHTLGPGRGLNFMVHYFTFITLIFRPIVKSFLPICFRNFCIRSIRYKEGLYFMTTFFLYPFFSCSDIHQSQYLDGCQAMGKSTFFIEAFCALRFWWYSSSCHSITPSSSAK